MSWERARERGGSGRRREGRGSSGRIVTVVRDILSHKLEQDELRSVRTSSEKEVLLVFCQTFHSERHFSQLSYGQRLSKLLRLVMTERVCEGWLGGCEDGEHVRCVLMTLRLLLRDETYQRVVVQEECTVHMLTKLLVHHAESYQQGDLGSREILQEITNIFQKLSSISCYDDKGVVGVAPEVLGWMVCLLTSRDLTVVHSALYTLTNTSKSSTGAAQVSLLSPFPSLLHILLSYDPPSQRLSSDLLLLLLCNERRARLALRDMDALPICLRMLHSDDLHILHRMVGILERLLEDEELQDEVRQLGGIPLILSLLRSDDSADVTDKTLALKTTCCSTVTQLLLNDNNSQHVIQGNGLYLLAKLVLPVEEKTERSEDKNQRETLQAHAWRALRYLYNLERNRRLFKCLFPPQLFAVFIDTGHYVNDLSPYTSLVAIVNSMSPSELSSLSSSIEKANQMHSPLFSVGGYHVQELLGSGAFGKVYKVRKRNSDVFLAMKEIKSSLPLLGPTHLDRSSSVGKLMNEVNIIKEQLHHPNVVYYHKCFEEGGDLYIVMELIEGAPLREHITSLAEKGEYFKEERIWKIFIQLALALRYIHKEKHVTHRDLTPSNIMVGEGDRLTITDFGLAKHKAREFSAMQSTVGTMSYWCPELVQSEPYTEKADIWAAGCILYQMATLQTPFHATNILALAKKIAEVSYPPIPAGRYSPLLNEVVSRCLTADLSHRPDSVGLGALLAGPLMRETDKMAAARDTLQRRLDRERQRAERHLNRTIWSIQQNHQLTSPITPSHITPSHITPSHITPSHITPSAITTTSSCTLPPNDNTSMLRKISDSTCISNPPILTSPASHHNTLTSPISHSHTLTSPILHYHTLTSPISPQTLTSPAIHPPILTSPTTTSLSMSQEGPIMETSCSSSPIPFHRWTGMETMRQSGGGPAQEGTTMQSRGGQAQEGTTMQSRGGQAQEGTTMQSGGGQAQEGTTMQSRGGPTQEGTTMQSRGGQAQEGTTMQSRGGPAQEGTTMQSRGGPAQEGTTVQSRGGPAQGRTMRPSGGGPTQEYGSDSDTVFPEIPPQLTNQLAFTDDLHSLGIMTTSSPVIGRDNPLRYRPARGRSQSAITPSQLQGSLSGRGSLLPLTTYSGGWNLPQVGVASSESPLRQRTSSSSSLLSTSSRHFREIADPVTQLLGQLQRLLVLTLASPTSSPCARQLVLEQYQRSLLHHRTSPAQVKGELHRLGARSGEGVWLLEEGAWSVGPRLVRKAMEEVAAHSHGLLLPPPTELSGESPNLTYDLLATMMDSLQAERQVNNKQIVNKYRPTNKQ